MEHEAETTPFLTRRFASVTPLKDVLKSSCILWLNKELRKQLSTTKTKNLLGKLLKSNM